MQRPNRWLDWIESCTRLKFSWTGFEIHGRITFSKQDCTLRRRTWSVSTLDRFFCGVRFRPIRGSTDSSGIRRELISSGRKALSSTSPRSNIDCSYIAPNSKLNHQKHKFQKAKQGDTFSGQNRDQKTNLQLRRQRRPYKTYLPDRTLSWWNVGFISVEIVSSRAKAYFLTNLELWVPHTLQPGRTDVKLCRCLEYGCLCKYRSLRDSCRKAVGIRYKHNYFRISVGSL